MSAYLWFSPQFFETEISVGRIYCIRNFKYLKSSKTSIETCPFLSQISSESDDLWPMTKDLWWNVGSNRTFWKTAKPFLTNKGYMTNECICIEKNGDIIRDKKVLVELFNESYKKNCRNIIWQGTIIFRKFWRYGTLPLLIKLYQNTVLIPVSKKLEGNFLRIKNLCKS